MDIIRINIEKGVLKNYVKVIVFSPATSYGMIASI
jgi:hypothetical protein